MITLARATMATTRSMSRNLAASSTQFEVRDRPDEKVFTMKLNDHYATVDYEKRGNVYDLIHSTIPASLRGKGYGTILAEKTFDYIASKNLRMKISCEFLRSVYEQNEDKYKRFVV